jgi:hypothetical protein
MKSVKEEVEALIATPGGLEAILANPKVAKATQQMIVREVLATMGQTPVLVQKSDYKD